MKLLTGLSLTIACALGLLVILFAPFIINWIFGEAFHEAIPILRIYTIYVPIAVLYAIVQNHLLTANKTRSMIVIGMSGALINILLNILLIPNNGAIGATMATIVAGICMIVIPVIMHIQQSNKK
jgi:O-antigen/teichoic acid export membrane protein